jgi:hypothetical protein
MAQLARDHVANCKNCWQGEERQHPAVRRVLESSVRRWGYLARISAKSDLAKQMADNMARMANVQGTVAADVLAETVKV